MPQNERIMWHMGKMMALLTALVMAIALTGCGVDTHEKLMGDMVGQMKELTSTLDTIKDEASAKAAPDKLKTIVASLNDLEDRADKLGEPSADIEKALEAKFAKEWDETGQKFMSSLGRIATSPNLVKHVEQDLREVMTAIRFIRRLRS